MSPRTIACYSDGLMLFLGFAQRQLGKPPTALELVDIDPDLILAFLDHLEQQRHNSVRSRNLRLSALRAFLKFAGRRDVSSLHAIERALSVPMKRFERRMVGFLTRAEMLAVLGQPGPSWTSQRDHLLLALLYNTAARVSEIIGVRVADVVLEGGACVHLHGKGRKQRAVPLWKTTVSEVRRWLRANPSLEPGSALLPNRDGHPMTRSNVEQRLDLAVARAIPQCRSLVKKRISPHAIRHATAMHLLQSGVAFNIIALWLGHESCVGSGAGKRCKWLIIKSLETPSAV
jgi:site-specific recombinase XerD